MFIGVDKDKNNIQLQKLNMDEVKGDGGGTGITNSDEGDTDEVFYSDETATNGDDKEEIAPLRKTGKDYMRNTACRPLRYFLVSNNFIVIVSPSCAVTPHSYGLDSINIDKCCSCTL